MEWMTRILDGILTATSKMMSNPGINVQCVALLEELDEYYGSIFLYKTKRSYPPGWTDNQKRLTRKAALSYTVENDTLYRQGKMVPALWENRVALLQNAHIDPDGKHVSKSGMLKLLDGVTWKGLYSDCVAYCMACPDCEYGNPIAEVANPEEEDEISLIAEQNYSHLISYLKEGKFSIDTDTSIHRAVLGIAKYFSLHHGLLMYRKSEKVPLRFFEISAREKKKAIKKAHEELSPDDHLEPQETLESLTKAYIWYQMKDSVTDYINQCCHKTDLSSPVSKRRVEIFSDYITRQKISSVDSTESEGLDMSFDDVQLDLVEAKREVQVPVSAVERGDKEHSSRVVPGSESSQTTTMQDPSVLSQDRPPAQEEVSYLENDTQQLSSSQRDLPVNVHSQGDTNIPEHIVHSLPGSVNIPTDTYLVTSADLVTSDPVTSRTVSSSILPYEETDNMGDGESSHRVTTSKEKTGARQGPKKLDSIKSNITTISDNNFPMLADHRYDKNTRGRFECKICNKTIRGMTKYQTHMYNHTGVKPYQCDVCHKRFTLVKTLRVHKRIHTGIFPYLCNICGKRFTSSTGVRLHVKSHNKGSPNSIQCEYCDRSFLTMNRYEKHRQFKHLAKDEVFNCKDCSKVFTTKRSMLRHARSYHQGIRHHTCELCGKSFFRKEYFTIHMNNHKNGKEEGRKDLSSLNLKLRPNQNVITETIASEANQLPQYFSISDPGGTRDGQVEVQIDNTLYALRAGTDSTTQLIPLQLEDRPAQNYQSMVEVVQEEEERNATTVEYRFPGVQYEIECGEEGIDEEALSAIGIVATAQLSQQNF